jgi:hypothetical protein
MAARTPASVAEEMLNASANNLNKIINKRRFFRKRDAMTLCAIQAELAKAAAILHLADVVRENKTPTA